MVLSWQSVNQSIAVSVIGDTVGGVQGTAEQVISYTGEWAGILVRAKPGKVPGAAGRNGAMAGQALRVEGLACTEIFYYFTKERGSFE